MLQINSVAGSKVRPLGTTGGTAHAVTIDECLQTGDLEL